MTHETLYFSLWFCVTCWLIWDSKRTNAKLHADSQASLERIARYLGDSDQR